MRHNMARRKLGRNTSHRKAMLRNMATSLFRHEKITTTVQKAKELRPFAEKLITMAKKETLHARRQVLRQIHDKEIVKKLFDTISVRFATRPGGYTRIIKTDFRRGDNAEMAIIELVSSEMTSVKKKAAPAKRKAAKKPAKEAAAVETEREEAVEAVEAAEEQPEEATAEAAETGEEKVEAKAETAEQAKPAEDAEEKPEKEDKKEE